MLKRTHPLITCLVLAAATVSLAACDTQALTQAVNNAAQSEAGKSLIHQAALALKAMDEGGVEVAYSEENILSVMVGGEEVKPTFDEAGNLLLDLPPGEEHDVVVGLKDGQKVNVPIRPEAGDFKGGKPPQFSAFVMPGGENQLFSEVARPGENVRDVFKGKAVRVELGAAELTNENLRRLYLGSIQAPRHTYFVEQGNLMLHPSNLWVMHEAVMHDRQGQMPPPGGQMQPPPPGGQMPPPPAFQVAQMPPPPGGQMAPPPAGSASLTFRLVVELSPGAYTVYKLDVTRVPGPPPLPAPGERPVFIAQGPPQISKSQLTVTKQPIEDLAKFEQETVKVQTGLKFLPPPPPRGTRPGGQMPPPPGGQMPPAPGGQMPPPPPAN